MKEPLRQTRFILAETDMARLPPSTAEVAFVGRSNVGKSSTICALCDNRTLARVSKTPGRTRGINVFEATRDRWLVDLPGYGYAKVSQKQRDYWPQMIGNYLLGRPTLACVYVLIDAEVGAGEIDKSMLNWLIGKNIPFRVVGTKVDRLGKSTQRERRIKLAESVGLNSTEIQWFSAKKGYGLDALRRDVIETLGIP